MSTRTGLFEFPSTCRAMTVVLALSEAAPAAGKLGSSSTQQSSFVAGFDGLSPGELCCSAISGNKTAPVSATAVITFRLIGIPMKLLAEPR